MSLLNDYSYGEITVFGGADLLTDRSMVGIHHGLLAKNVEYNAGSVGTRHGYAAIQDLLSGGFFEIYNWIAPFSQISSNYSDSAVAMMSYTGTTGLDIYNLNTTTSSGRIASVVYCSPRAYGASMVGVGLRLYQCAFDSSQRGMTGGSVATVYNNAGSVAEIGSSFNLFNGPSPTVPTTSEPGVGVVTAGVHRIGYLVEFVSGFTTRVSPDASTVFAAPAFAPVSVTASGSKNLQVSLALNWNVSHARSAEIVAVSIVMTTTADLNQYYIVPGSRTPLVSRGSSAAIDITFSVSDGDLSSQGIDATPYLYWLTQGSNNTTTGAFLTRHICLFGNRMAYLATQTDNAGNLIDALYISEPNNYQAITADQHVIQLPGQKPIVTVFRMGAVNYILGPHEIWSVTDNNDVPASWAAPHLLDGRHGTQAIHGVEVAPSGYYAWIADQGGLYLFMGGPITSLPISYYQTPDWNRINWGSAYCVKIRDDASNKRVHVMVPLDGVTTPSHIMTWDYTNGITPDAVMYSLDSISGYSLGSMELVRNNLLAQATGNTGKVELWVSGGGKILRKTSDADFRSYKRSDSTLTNIVVLTSVATATTPSAHGLYVGQRFTLSGAVVAPNLNGAYVIASVPSSTTFTFTTVSVADATYTDATIVIATTPYQDNGAAINSPYRTCPLPGRGVSQGQILMHHGFHARLKGAGTITPTIYDIDAIHSFPCSTFTLSTAPDQDTLVLARIRNELAFVEFATNTIDTYWQASYLRWYYSPYLMQR